MSHIRQFGLYFRDGALLLEEAVLNEHFDVRLRTFARTCRCLGLVASNPRRSSHLRLVGRGPSRALAALVLQQRRENFVECNSLQFWPFTEATAASASSASFASTLVSSVI